MDKESAAHGLGLERSGRTSHPNASSISRLRIIDIILRSAVLACVVASLSAMLTSSQQSQVFVLGLHIGVSLRWNRSQPFEFLVVINILAAAYALMQFVHQSVVFVKKLSPTRRRVWALLAADQICTYLLLAAAAAEAGASRMNKSAFKSLGVQDIHVAGVCKVLDKFCNRATIAFILTLLATIASATSAVLDVYLLTLAC